MERRGERRERERERERGGEEKRTKGKQSRAEIIAYVYLEWHLKRDCDNLFHKRSLSLAF